MKKIFLILVFISFSISSMFAINAVLSPYIGAYGVNVGSKLYNENIIAGPEDGGWIDINVEHKPNDGKYNDNAIVAMGEINNLQFNRNSNDDYFIRITVNTDSDFNYVSISNPSYRRPYTLTVIGKCSATINGGNQHFIKSQTLEANGSNSVTFYFNEGRTTSGTIVPDYDNPSNNSLWFDMILGLPVRDITTSGLLTLPSGEQMVLGRVDDYASFVTITMEYGKVGSAPEITSLSIPFSGYYRADNSDKDNTSYASLHVDTNAKSTALDIRNDALTEIEIGKLRFAETIIFNETKKPGEEGYKSEDDIKAEINSIRLFLSASSSPIVQDSDGFRLIHAGYEVGDSINDYNSVPFTIRVRSSNSSEMVEFDGRDYVLGNEIISKAIVPIIHTSGDGSSGFTHAQTKSYYANYEGELSVYIDYGGYPMKPGLYQEEIYVHVVAQY